MFFRQLIDKLRSLFHPFFAARRRIKEETENHRFVQKLFSEQRLSAVLPHFSMRKHGQSDKWVIRTRKTVTPYLVISSLPSISKTTVRHTAERILTTVTINRNSFLTLTEYLNPSRVRLRMSENDEVLAAEMEIKCRERIDKIAEFYVTNDVS